MSCLAAFSFESVTSATAEIYAQIKKAIGTGPNTFAAIAGIGTDEFLNQRCALVFDLESIFLAQTLKIVLQQYLLEADSG
jgi:hypothetical protein